MMDFPHLTLPMLTDDFIMLHESSLTPADRFMILALCDIRSERGKFYWERWKALIINHPPGMLSLSFFPKTLPLNVHLFKTIDPLWKYQKLWHIFCAVYLCNNHEWTRQHILRNQYDTFGIFRDCNMREYVIFDKQVHSLKENYISIQLSSLLHTLLLLGKDVENDQYRYLLYLDLLTNQHSECDIVI